MYRSDKGIRGLSITSGNTSPTFQGKEAVFYHMTQLIEIFIIVTLFFAVPLGRDHRSHPSRNRIGQDIICVIATVCQQDLRRNTLCQADSFFAIRSGTFCNKYSDWHTIRIHGQMYFGVEPPFVLDIS